MRVDQGGVAGAEARLTVSSAVILDERSSAAPAVTCSGRRITLAWISLLAIVAVLLGAGIAAAVPATASVRDFSGTATATFTFNAGPSCPGNAQIGSVSGSLARRHRPTWTFTAPRICVSSIGHQGLFSGKARITARQHEVIYARVSGNWESIEGVATATISFAIQGGTGRFVHATGSIIATPGSLDFSTGNFIAPMSGTVTN
jgi:hypothetical protein